MISVVCASLGRSSLIPLISSLLSCKNIDEIIIVLPPNLSPSANLFKLCSGISNARLVNASTKGQVNQRVYGVRLCKSPFVMFIDDDISIDVSIVDLLLKRLLSLPTLSVVAPSIVQVNSATTITNKSFTFYFKALNFIDRVLYPFGSRFPYLLTYFHFPTPKSTSSMVPSAWLAGGCMIMPSSIAPLESYYCFPGKAYAEDIYLSSKLIESGATLYLVRDLQCFTPLDRNDSCFNLQLFVRLSIHRLTHSDSMIHVVYSLLLIPLHLLIVLVLVNLRLFTLRTYSALLAFIPF